VFELNDRPEPAWMKEDKMKEISVSKSFIWPFESDHVTIQVEGV
jgi:hypothetical protein